LKNKITPKFLKRANTELGGKNFTEQQFVEKVLITSNYSLKEFSNKIGDLRNHIFKHLAGLKLEMDLGNRTKIIRLGRDPIKDKFFVNSDGKYPLSADRVGHNSKIKGRVDSKDTVAAKYQLGSQDSKNGVIEDIKGDRYPISKLTVIQQPMKGLISRALTASLLNKISFTAPDKHGQIMNFFAYHEQNRGDVHKTTERLKIKCQKTMLEVEGVILKAPTIHMGGDETMMRSPKEVAEGEWKVSDYKFFESPVRDPIKVATLILHEGRKGLAGQERGNITKMLSEVYNMLRKKGGFVYEGCIDGLSKDNFTVMSTDIIDVDDYHSKKKDAGYDLIICVLMGDEIDNNHTYKKIVSTGDSIKGVRTCCLNYATIKKGLKESRMQAIVENFTMKINFKSEGVNHKAVISHFPKDSMMIGADVTHAETESSSSSIAAIIGSVDDTFTKYVPIHASQNHRQEMISKFRSHVEKLIESYHEINNKYPKHIFYYRDGVSESQFQQVLNEEVKQTVDALHKFKLSGDTKVNCVIVQKRHTTKLFCHSKEDQVGRTKNTPAGTIADTVIVNARDRMEFYLQSHFACKGTARSTKYVVIKNDSDLSMADYEIATNGLCNNYQLAPKAVSLPAPVYYAHKHADRARCYEGGILAYDHERPLQRNVI